MKARLEFRFANYPVVSILPDEAEFNSFHGHVDVHFLLNDIDTGRYEIKPYVMVNVSFGNLSVKQAAKWSEIFLAAACIADRTKPDQSTGLHPVFNEVWEWLDKWRQEQHRVAAA